MKTIFVSFMSRIYYLLLLFLLTSCSQVINPILSDLGYEKRPIVTEKELKLNNGKTILDITKTKGDVFIIFTDGSIMQIKIKNNF